MENNKMSKKDNALQALKFVCFSASAGVIQVVVFTILDIEDDLCGCTNHVETVVLMSRKD